MNKNSGEANWEPELAKPKKSKKSKALKIIGGACMALGLYVLGSTAYVYNSQPMRAEQLKQGRIPVTNFVAGSMLHGLEKTLHALFSNEDYNEFSSDGLRMLSTADEECFWKKYHNYVGEAYHMWDPKKRDRYVVLSGEGQRDKKYYIVLDDKRVADYENCLPTGLSEAEAISQWVDMQQRAKKQAKEKQRTELPSSLVEEEIQVLHSPKKSIFSRISSGLSGLFEDDPLEGIKEQHKERMEAAERALVEGKISLEDLNQKRLEQQRQMSQYVNNLIKKVNREARDKIKVETLACKPLREESIQEYVSCVKGITEEIDEERAEKVERIREKYKDY